jgi:hypothetical protein
LPVPIQRRLDEMSSAVILINEKPSLPVPVQTHLHWGVHLYKILLHWGVYISPFIITMLVFTSQGLNLWHGTRCLTGFKVIWKFTKNSNKNIIYVLINNIIIREGSIHVFKNYTPSKLTKKKKISLEFCVYCPYCYRYISCLKLKILKIQLMLGVQCTHLWVINIYCKRWTMSNATFTASGSEETTGQDRSSRNVKPMRSSTVRGKVSFGWVYWFNIARTSFLSCCFLASWGCERSISALYN